MTDVIMPKMGESITEGTILEWKKSIGDTIAKDETLLEISTDKVDSEVPSPASGTVISILAEVNETVPVGNVIAKIGNPSDPNIESQDNIVKEETIKHIETKEYKNDIDSKIKTNTVNSERFYSPLVKSIAKAENVLISDLDLIIGSGHNGRVNKSDILNFIANRDSSQLTDPIIQSRSDSIVDNKQNKIEPMSRMRKKIAEHMVNSIKISPHVYTTVEADVTNLVNMRLKYKDDFKQRSGISLTYTPMLLDACIGAIQEFPLINSSVEGENIIHHQNINMGVAVALPDDNLIVPVIQKSDEKNFLGLARSTADLAQRARKNILNPEDIFGSTFTLTNPGVFGGLFGMGIINQPNVGILAVGSFQKRPVVKETEYGDTIIIRNMVYLTLSYDHRIIDGAYGTKFLSRFVEILENYDDKKIKN